ncbi:hypothetical protein RKD18_005466 [Streptomyces phaeoluteigriseus]
MPVAPVGRVLEALGQRGLQGERQVGGAAGELRVEVAQPLGEAFPGLVAVGLVDGAQEHREHPGPHHELPEETDPPVAVLPVQFPAVLLQPPDVVGRRAPRGRTVRPRPPHARGPCLVLPSLPGLQRVQPVVVLLHGVAVQADPFADHGERRVAAGAELLGDDQADGVGGFLDAQPEQLPVQRGGVDPVGDLPQRGPHLFEHSALGVPQGAPVPLDAGPVFAHRPDDLAQLPRVVLGARDLQGGRVQVQGLGIVGTAARGGAQPVGERAAPDGYLPNQVRDLLAHLGPHATSPRR